MKITAKLLKRKKACAKTIAMFESFFPNGVVPTEELCCKYACYFNWRWAGNNLLNLSNSAKFWVYHDREFFKQWKYPFSGEFKDFDQLIAVKWCQLWIEEHSGK